MRISTGLLCIALALGSFAGDRAFAAKRLPGFGNMDGTAGGRRGGGGGVKTGNYNDSANPDSSAAAKQDSMANDPNGGMNQGAKDELAGDAAAMDTAQKKVEKQFESSQEWQDASSEYDKAKAANDKARAAVLSALKDKPEHKNAVDAAQKASQQLADLRKSGDATPEQMTAAATASLQAQSALTKMESDACAADPAVVAAKAKLTEAAAAMSELRKKEHAAVLADSDYQAAKQKYDAAKTRTASANKPAAGQP